MTRDANARIPVLDEEGNSLKRWIQKSREEERRAPQRYLSYYRDRVVCDEENAYMAQETFDEIRDNCGQYNGTTPTGEYCGKMFIRHGHLVWFGIDKKYPMYRIQWNFRRVIINALRIQDHQRLT